MKVGSQSLSIVAAGFALACTGTRVSDYPSRPIVYICQASAGGSSDRFVRHVAKFFAEGGHLGAPISVEYKAGGGGAIAANYLQARAGNPYYLLNTSGNFVAAPLRDPSVPGYETLTPIARLAFDLNSVLVRADSRYRSMADLVAAARADPGAISWGGTSVGSQDHLSVLLLEKAAGVKFNFVSFAGAGEVLAALLGGHIEVGSAEPVVAQPHARAKKLRILGLMSDERLASVPDVPTLREQGLDVVLNMQRGVVAASGIPADARGTLVQAFRRMAAMPEWKAYLAEEGLRDAFLADDDYGRFLGQETQRWGTLLREAGLAR